MKPEPQQSFPLGPALVFLDQLWQLNHALLQLSGHMDKRLGVTAQQRLIVRCLGKYPGMTAGQLAALLHLDAGTISASLRRLEEKRVIERRRDPRDKRRASLGLTEKGRALDRSAKGTVEYAVEQLLLEGNQQEVATTARVLGQLTALLIQECEPGLNAGERAARSVLVLPIATVRRKPQ